MDHLVQTGHTGHPGLAGPPTITSLPHLPVPRWLPALARLWLWLPLLLALASFAVPVHLSPYLDEWDDRDTTEVGLPLALALLGLVVLAVSVAAGCWLLSLARWRWPEETTVFAARPVWLGVLTMATTVVGVNVAAFSLLALRVTIEEDRFVSAALSQGRFDYVDVLLQLDDPLTILAVAAFFVASCGNLGLWLYRIKRHPLLGLTAQGVQYEVSPHRGFLLPWQELQRVEVGPPHPGVPEALIAWPVPESALLTDHRYSALWSPAVNGYLIPRLRARFGADPNDVGFAVVEHSDGRHVPERAQDPADHGV